jgi:hypothetical protein
MQTRYHILKGSNRVMDILTMPGIHGVYPNPFGDGMDIVEIIHDGDPDLLPIKVQDQTIGNVILRRIED